MKIRKLYEYLEEDDYEEEDEEDIKYYVEPTYYQVRKYVDNQDYPYELMGDDQLTLEQAKEELMYCKEDYPDDNFYIVKVTEEIVK